MHNYTFHSCSAKLPLKRKAPTHNFRIHTKSSSGITTIQMTNEGLAIGSHSMITQTNAIKHLSYLQIFFMHINTYPNCFPEKSIMFLPLILVSVVAEVCCFINFNF